jgi:hypothetical protein
MKATPGMKRGFVEGWTEVIRQIPRAKPLRKRPATKRWTPEGPDGSAPAETRGCAGRWTVTKAQRADALLRAEARWENGSSKMELDEDEEDIVDSVGEMGDVTNWFTQWASAALSEVGALGFDIEGAEKVCSFERKPGGYRTVRA